MIFGKGRNANVESGGAVMRQGLSNMPLSRRGVVQAFKVTRNENCSVAKRHNILFTQTLDELCNFKENKYGGKEYGMVL